MQTPRITLKPGYADSKGVVHGTLEQAQRAELERLIGEPLTNNAPEHQLEAVVNTIFAKSDEVLAILTASPDGEDMSVATPPKVAKRRLSLTTVLDRCRRFDLTDDQIAAKVADGTITKVPKIGDASVALLKEWAAAYRPAPAPPEVATAAFAQMRDVVDRGASGSELREAVNAA